MLVFVLFLIFNVEFIVASELTEGDECTLESGEEGICTNGHECEYAIDLIASGQRPEICGFDGMTPIVCCIQKSKPLPQPVLEPGALSNKKCREFPLVATPVIYSGKRADPAEFPHMALVGFGEKNNIQWQCGGSLISLNYVITAAHCLHSRELGSARWVRMGDLDISTDTNETKHQQFQIKKIVSHPQYDPPSRYNDIALLELEHLVLHTHFVYPACLDTSRNHDKGTEMLITGWGKTAFIGESSNHLLKATVHVVPNADCRTHYRNEDTSQLSNGIVDELQICAGGNSMEDTCQGDSGGPLMIMNSNKTDEIVYEIVGVTSFGQACGISRSPGVYTRVYHYLTWIENIIWPQRIL